jgi:hypothetical protein
VAVALVPPQRIVIRECARAAVAGESGLEQRMQRLTVPPARECVPSVAGLRTRSGVPDWQVELDSGKAGDFFWAPPRACAGGPLSGRRTPSVGAGIV